MKGLLRRGDTADDFAVPGLPFGLSLLAVVRKPRAEVSDQVVAAVRA